MKARLRLGVICSASALLAVQGCTTADAGFSSSGIEPDGEAGAKSSAGRAGNDEPRAGAGNVAGASGDGNRGGSSGDGARAGSGGANGGGPGGAGTSGGGSGNAGSSGSAGNAGSAGMAGGPTQPPACGNAVREVGEQCDDGNQASRDGCNSACAFEQSQRIDWLQVQFAATALCTNNAFGVAFRPVVQPILQASVSERVQSGALSMLFGFGGLDDLAGKSDATVALGVMYGKPAAGASYDGTNDLDWWYAPTPSTLGANGQALSVLPGSIGTSVLTAGPGKIQFPLLSEAPLAMSNALLRVRLGDASKPLASTGAPPGHLASEHLSAELVSFERGGTPNEQAGELCGNLSAGSLANEAIPAAYAAGGDTPCLQSYSVGNTLLDVLIGGCTIAGVGGVVAVTQPDQVDASVPAAGAGAPYRLQANAAKTVVTCRDKNNAPTTLATCLNAAAYSSAFKLTTRRVIVK